LTKSKPAAEELADAMFATITHTRDTIERAKRKYEKKTQDQGDLLKFSTLEITE